MMSKTYTAAELDEVRRLHRDWIDDKTGGIRANLSSANLSGAYLSSANLSGAYLSGAYLSGADLSGANLSGADLHSADLSGADLGSAYLSGAYLSGADLRSADLSGANLGSAYLSGANLSGAYLRSANLSGADLRSANLSGAYLRSADLSGADLGARMIVPETGSFEGYKKLSNGTICRVQIPADAKRTSSLIGRKCRAEYVIVLEGEGASSHDKKTKYAPGLTVRADSYDDDIRVECSNGIHFFLTKQEASDY